jgi:ribonuclease-3
MTNFTYFDKEQVLSLSGEEMQTLWSALEERLGHRFADRVLLARALTHRSYANESRDPEVVDNERLEFLGDAVLDMVVGHLLLITHAAADEGELSRQRAELVSEPSLARLARELLLGDCLLLGRGECRSGGRSKESLLANTLEALFGAVFLDAGYVAADGVIRRLFAPLLHAQSSQVGQDYKTRLQERLQAQRQRPEYRLVAACGPDHQRHYQIEVLMVDSVLGRGEGTTKKRAEQDAARQALEFLEQGGGATDV